MAQMMCMLPLYVLHLLVLLLLFLKNIHPFFMQFTTQQAARDAVQEILKTHTAASHD